MREKYIAFVTNLNLKTDILPLNAEEKVVNEAYFPLVNLILKSKVPFTLFFDGWTLEILNSQHSQLIKIFKELLNLGIIEIGENTYGHPIIPLISIDDLKLHITYSVELLSNIFGISPKVFCPPEWCIDPTVPWVLGQHGIDSLILLDSNFYESYNFNTKNIFQLNIIPGINESKTYCFIAFGGKNLEIRELLYKLFGGEEKAESIKSQIERILENYGYFDEEIRAPLFVLYFDSEVFFFEKTEQNPFPFQHLSELIALFKESNYQFVTLSQYKKLYLQKHLNIFSIYPKADATYKPMEIWTKGSEKLDILLRETKEILKRIQDKKIFKKAVKYYLLAQNSDARLCITEKRRKGIDILGKAWFGNIHRYFQTFEFCLKAQEEVFKEKRKI